MKARILFLCAKGSSRSMLAASLLLAEAAQHWEVFSTPTLDEQGRTMAEQVLHEQGIPLIAADRLIQPMFGMFWEEGIVLCRGTTDT
jgi:protein-tyrosine-phosphatase